MNFAALPPEVNSGLMYTGAGSGPIRAAATAWKTMAAELETAANNYRTVITALTQSWQGPSATAMAAAATPYTTWMSTTATKASHAGTQAAAAATAYETAYAMTVPPAVIAANRAQLATLIATNFLGTNTAAIAATEAHYSEMWAQDTTAMYTYATNAAAATQLSTFTTPAEDTSGGSYEGAGEEGLLLNILVALLEVDSIAPFEGGGAGLEWQSKRPAWRRSRAWVSPEISAPPAVWACSVKRCPSAVWFLRPVRFLPPGWSVPAVPEPPRPVWAKRCRWAGCRCRGPGRRPHPQHFAKSPFFQHNPALCRQRPEPKSRSPRWRWPARPDGLWPAPSAPNAAPPRPRHPSRPIQ